VSRFGRFGAYRLGIVGDRPPGPIGRWPWMAHGDGSDAPMICLDTIEVFEGIPVRLRGRGAESALRTEKGPPNRWTRQNSENCFLKCLTERDLAISAQNGSMAGARGSCVGCDGAVVVDSQWREGPLSAQSPGD
jgi:hypothetical protein